MVVESESTTEKKENVKENRDVVSSEKELNFRKLEESKHREQLRAERAEEELKRSLESLYKTQKDVEAMKEMLTPKQKSLFEEAESIDEVSPKQLGDYIDETVYKKTTGIEKKLEDVVERKVRERLEKAKSERWLEDLELRYPDLHEKITEESLKKLKEKDELFVSTVEAIPDKKVKVERLYMKLKAMEKQESSEKEAASIVDSFGRRGNAFTKSSLMDSVDSSGMRKQISDDPYLVRAFKK